MPHPIWKGAISFGLVHVPVALYSASSEGGTDFDWIDKRSMDPVGYKRINKRTGREIQREQIVKGVKVDDGEYVILSDDEIQAAYPKTTQTIEIESFVDAADIAPTYYEKPYHLVPIAKSEKVYGLLREALSAAKVIGIARVVMHTKEHLCAVMPLGRGLVLNTLRWASELRSDAELDLPAKGKNVVKPAELKLAMQLIESMSAAWQPEHYTDNFTAAIAALVDKRVKAGKTATVEAMEDIPATADNVVDLTALLAQSLGKRKPVDQDKAPTKAAKVRGKSRPRARKARKSA